MAEMKGMKVNRSLKSKIESLSDAQYPTPAPVIEDKGKYIIWKDGVPIPHAPRHINKKQANELIQAVASLPFTEEDDPFSIYPSLHGMSYLEVALIQTAQQAALGNQSAANMLLDRLLGKPKQSVESTNVSMTYQDLLDNIARNNNIHAPGEVEEDILDI